jgi:hypothetical protein
MDTPPIKSMILWLADEVASIAPSEEMKTERSMSELSELKRRIAAGEYRLDPHAIAAAMVSRADPVLTLARRSEVFEPRERDNGAGGVDQL